MKIKIWIVGILLCFWGISSQRIHAQAPEISPSQARQVLLSYLAPPDTTLTAQPVVDTNTDGHTEYLFYGNAGGSYGIDAATREKEISFAGIAGGGATPTNPPFTAIQLQQTATTYVSQHFPNYSAAFHMNAGSIDVQSDANEYYITYYLLSPSGAEQPINGLVVVEESSGKIKSYEEKALSININTSPAITQSQAVQIGQSWINQNMSTDPAEGQFQTDIGGQSPVQFEVFVDHLLNQILLYKICFNSIVVIVDAQSGSVIGIDRYLGVSTNTKIAAAKSLMERETFWGMHTSLSNHSLAYSAISVQSQIYVKESYLKLCKISKKTVANALILGYGHQKISLRIAEVATKDKRTAWRRKDGLYIPLAALQTLTNAFVKNTMTQEVVILLPKKKVARN